MKPIPPSWARAIARWASVTVSMAAETIGILREIDLREAGGDVHLGGQDVRPLGHQQDVVEGQRLGQPLLDHQPVLLQPQPNGNGSRRRNPDSAPVALLVLLAAPAGAGVVAADLRPLAADRLHLVRPARRLARLRPRGRRPTGWPRGR